MTLRNRFITYTENRIKIDSNDSFATYEKWDQLIEMLSEDESETIKLLKTSSKIEIDLTGVYSRQADPPILAS
jgi:hypothetical protein